jgi:glycyl-tRNA synthetase
MHNPEPVPHATEGFSGGSADPPPDTRNQRSRYQRTDAMTQTDTTQQTAQKSMDAIVALCRRRGFIFQSSEIYGGINGFWDYGPLGALLKKNLKDAWWADLVTSPPIGPDGLPLEMVPLDTTIIMNPKVWEASGHLQGFNDPMVDCTETKKRYRADHLVACIPPDENENVYVYVQGDPTTVTKRFRGHKVNPLDDYKHEVYLDLPDHEKQRCVGPDATSPNTLTAPRQFNLMFQTYVGALQSDDAIAYLRPETAQGIFTNFRNVVDTSRVKVPFGIAQIGKAFRNEVTPRNYTFRSREFEQMEVEFFIPDPEAIDDREGKVAREWYEYWRDQRHEWWKSIGLAGDNLQLREHDQDELAHYAQEGAGTSDVEYRFPFTYPGFGELEGVAHRTNYDLRQHAEHSGMGDKFKYFDQEADVKYFPHVIEPSAGADRGTLALLCEAYTPDESRPSKVYMDFHPRMAPIKAAVFPLVNKDGMPEKARDLYLQLRKRWSVQFDVKQNIGKRYARMDEAGTPYCFTIDGQTLEDDTVTVRERNTQGQERINIDQVERYLAERIEG